MQLAVEAEALPGIVRNLKVLVVEVEPLHVASRKSSNLKEQNGKYICGEAVLNEIPMTGKGGGNGSMFSGRLHIALEANLARDTYGE